MKKFYGGLAATALLTVGLSAIGTPAHAAVTLQAPTGVTVTGVSANEVDLEFTDPNLATDGTNDDYLVTLHNARTGADDTVQSYADLDGTTVDLYVYLDTSVAKGGDSVTATVTVQDDDGVNDDSAPSSPVSFVAAAPYLDTPYNLTLTGAWAVGGTLTATPTVWPGESSAGAWTPGASITYAWILDPHETADDSFVGTTLATTTSPSIVLPASAAGHVIGVRANGHEDGYQDNSVSNGNVYWSLHTVADGSLRMSTPKVTGKAKVGKKLKASPGSWTPGTTFSYQWLANGAPIKKAHKSTLKLTKKQKGAKVSVVVTGHAPAGYASTAATGTVVTSKATKKVK